MKILFITYYFPPFNSIGAVRTGKTAKYLIKLGHDVKVVSCGDQILLKNLSLEISEHLVEYTPWLNINSPVEFLIGGKQRVAASGYAPSASHLPNWILKMGTYYREVLNFPDGEIGWFPFAKRAGGRLIRQWHPDLIFASALPYTSLLVAAALSRKYKVPWIAELRDLWADHHNRTKIPLRQYFEKSLERLVLTSACGMVTVSDPLKEIIESKFSIPCKVITNGFDPDDRPDITNIPFSNGTDNIAYTGQIYASQEQDPSPLFKALQQMGKEKEKIRVHFYGRNITTAYHTAVDHDVSHLVEIHKPVSYKESLSIQSQADLLFLLCGQSPPWKGVYTGKLYEYLDARRPILCIGNTEGSAANLIRERRAGISLNDPEKIAFHLKQWIRQKNDIGEIPYLPSEVSRGFTRKEQTENLIEFFQSCLNNPVGSIQ